MISNQHRKQLQKLMSEANWGAFEAFFDYYLQHNFIQTSIKRNSEFETIWQAASDEGGKRHLQNFKQQLEDEANKV